MCGGAYKFKLGTFEARKYQLSFHLDPLTETALLLNHTRAPEYNNRVKLING